MHCAMEVAAKLRVERGSDPGGILSAILFSMYRNQAHKM